MLAWQILELIHALVETLDRHFDNVCELDIMSQVSLILEPPMKSLACVHVNIPHPPLTRIHKEPRSHEERERERDRERDLSLELFIYAYGRKAARRGSWKKHTHRP
jgi:hypothetical protein